jgi:ATP phosphoribosyltransferase regulatory subunit HisZ
VARRERSEVRSRCPELLPVVESGLPASPDDLGEPGATRLRGLLALRDELAPTVPQVRFSVDLAEFAAAGQGDRSYYDGLVFRAYAGSSALPVGGGGRYDRMFRALGAEVPAVGFSVSVDRLVEAGRPAR